MRKALRALKLSFFSSTGMLVARLSKTLDYQSYSVRFQFSLLTAGDGVNLTNFSMSQLCSASLLMNLLDKAIRTHTAMFLKHFVAKSFLIYSFKW